MYYIYLKTLILVLMFRIENTPNQNLFIIPLLTIISCFFRSQISLDPNIPHFLIYSHRGTP